MRVLTFIINYDKINQDILEEEAMPLTGNITISVKRLRLSLNKGLSTVDDQTIRWQGLEKGISMSEAGSSIFRIN